MMSVITSKDSKTFKELQRLTQKKYRDSEGAFLAESPNVVGEAVETDGIDVLKVFAREGSGYESFTDDVTVLSPDLFDRVSDTMTSQGVLAVIRKPDRGSVKALLAHGKKTCVSSDDRQNGISSGVIILDRLQDPGNIGTILRTAEGAGIQAAIFIKGTCDPFSPKVVRACAGSILRMPIAFCDSAEELIEAAHEAGYRLAVTDVRNGVPYYDAGLNAPTAPSGAPSGTGPVSAPSGTGPVSSKQHLLGQVRIGDRQPKIALVIGNEGNGVSDTFLGAADILVNIPMQGKLESLNASVAAALLMYEMARPHE